MTLVTSLNLIPRWCCLDGHFCEPARRPLLMEAAATLLALRADADYTSQSKGGSVIAVQAV